MKWDFIGKGEDGLEYVGRRAAETKIKNTRTWMAFGLFVGAAAFVVHIVLTLAVFKEEQALYDVAYADGYAAGQNAERQVVTEEIWDAMPDVAGCLLKGKE